MRGINKVIIAGNLGSDPELRYTATGRAVCHFRVAVNRRWRDTEGQLQERVDWFRVSAWGRLAEIGGQYLAKSSPVYVEGRLETRSYEGVDGSPRYVTEVVASDMVLLPRGSSLPIESEEEVEADEEEDVEVPL